MMLVGMCLGIPDSSKEAAAIAPSWFVFFLIFGAATTLVGIVSFFLLPSDHIAPNRENGYFKHMVVGFRPKTVKANPLFYIALLSFLFFNIGVDSFMPYIMVYFQNKPSFSGNGFYLGLGAIMGVAAIAVIIVGIFLERIGKLKVLIPSAVMMAGGALGLFLCGDSFGLCILFGIFLIGGYLIGTASLGAEIRDLTPKGDVGAFQSVRMVFAVMLPMVIGSNLSSAVFQTSPTPNAYGVLEKAPDRSMFLVTMIASLLSIAPIVWLYLASSKKKKQGEAK